jgi:hypothetical protein
MYTVKSIFHCNVFSISSFQQYDKNETEDGPEDSTGYQYLKGLSHEKLLCFYWYR